MKIQTDRGLIELSPEIFSSICGYSATNCYGVKGMAGTSVADGISYLLKKENMTRGVKVTFDGEAVNIALHIIVEHGINVNAAGHAIMRELRYVVEKFTGAKTGKVDVFVDGITTE